MKKINNQKKVPMSLADMEELFESDGFFHSCRKQQIMAEGEAYYAIQSKDENSFLLVQEISNEPILLASLPWKEEYLTINPFLLKKEQTQSQTPCCSVDSEENCVIKKPKIRKVGMMEGWDPPSP